MFRISIFGESHGESVGINIDGCPAGLVLSPEEFNEDLERRKGGMQKVLPPAKNDRLSSKWHLNNVTTGAPITILFENNNTRSEIMKAATIPRPGHADFVLIRNLRIEDFRAVDI